MINKYENSHKKLTRSSLAFPRVKGIYRFHSMFKLECNDEYNKCNDILTEIDECAIATHNCHGAAHCSNNPGSFTCKCWESYTGNGVSCEPLGEWKLC